MPAIAALWVITTAECRIHLQHDHPGMVVKRAGRFVAQQHIGAFCKGTGAGDPRRCSPPESSDEK